MTKEFTPKLVSLIKEGIDKKQISTDIASGVVVGIVALPLAIAFAIASGVSPEKGLITAILAGFVISAFGGSRVQIGGPTGAFIVIVYGIMSEYGFDGLLISTLMAGVIMIGFGLVRLGNFMKFVPYSLIVGFTSGIALIIFSSQINDFLGLGITKLPADFIGKWQVYFQGIDHINAYALGIALFTILLTLYFHKITKKVPGSLVAILLSSVLVAVFELPVETIESKFGNIPAAISIPDFPAFNLDKLQSLIQPAFAIALLGSIESLLSAVVADGMIGGRHRPNIELIAQGGANIISSIFGGIPATGAIARTATNIKNGGRTPIAGIVHALTLLLIMLVFAPYAKLIPLSCLAGVLVVVAYNMSEWRHFVSILKTRSSDVIILLSTFFFTVVFDLIIAIEIGIVLSSFLFMKRMSDSIKIDSTIPESEDDILFKNEVNYNSNKILLFEVSGPVFFGAAQQFQDTLVNINVKPEYVVIRLRHVPFIDATGFNRLKEVIRSFHNRGTKVILSGVSENLIKELERNSIYSYIPKDLIFSDIDSAMNWIKSNE